MKTKRCWLRVAIISGAIGLIVSIIYIYSVAKFSCQFSGGCNDLASLMLHVRTELFTNSLYFIVTPLILIGMIIGLIYCRLKRNTDVVR